MNEQKDLPISGRLHLRLLLGPRKNVTECFFLRKKETHVRIVRLGVSGQRETDGVLILFLFGGGTDDVVHNEISSVRIHAPR